MDWRKWMFELGYRVARPRWDTGVSPPELVAYVDSHAPGRAIDLGCGTGTNAIYLAEHGWDVVGVDFARRAIAAAESKLPGRVLAGRVEFVRADAASPPRFQPRFDLAVDIGCFHSLSPERRVYYVESLVELLSPRGEYLLYVFRPAGALRPGLTDGEVRALFEPQLQIETVEEGRGRPSAWYQMRRTL